MEILVSVIVSALGTLLVNFLFVRKLMKKVDNKMAELTKED